MILEVALITIKSEQTQAFEYAFSTAQAIIAGATGYISHQLKRCIEEPNKYVLLIQWKTLEDHTVGFRQSAAFQEWKQQLHHFYDSPALVQHYETLF